MYRLLAVLIGLSESGAQVEDRTGREKEAAHAELRPSGRAVFVLQSLRGGMYDSRPFLGQELRDFDLA